MFRLTKEKKRPVWGIPYLPIRGTRYIILVNGGKWGHRFLTGDDTTGVILEKVFRSQETEARMLIINALGVPG